MNNYLADVLVNYVSNLAAFASSKMLARYLLRRRYVPSETPKSRTPPPDLRTYGSFDPGNFNRKSNLDSRIRETLTLQYIAAWELEDCETSL